MTLECFHFSECWNIPKFQNIVISTGKDVFSIWRKGDRMNLNHGWENWAMVSCDTFYLIAC